MQAPPTIFDRRKVRQNRTQAMEQHAKEPAIFSMVRERTLDRLLDVTRTFHHAFVCGPGSTLTAQTMTQSHRVESVTSSEFIDPAAAAQPRSNQPPLSLISDDEWVPFGPDSFDLVLSVLSLHWVNDLPGALIQLRRCLQEDGLFLAVLFGGTTLYELRECLLDAETQLMDGVTPRVSPFVDVRDAGNLLVRAGFALPVADTDTIVQEYENMTSLFGALKTMGELNAIVERSRGLATPRLFALADSLYEQRFGTKDGGIKATFEIVTLTGWAPSDIQQKPLAPGSVRRRLSDALDTDENPL